MDKIGKSSQALLSHLRGNRYREGGLYRLFEAYREDILKRADTSFLEAVYILRCILMIDPSNEDYMGFCIMKGLFYNLKQVIKCCKRGRERAISEEFLEIFLKAAKGLCERLLLGALCQIADILPGRYRRFLIEKIRLDPAAVDIGGIYYLLSDYCIKYDRLISEYIHNKLEETKNPNEASFNNPAFVILKLHEEGCIHSTAIYSDILENEPIYRFASDPINFDYEKFDPAWWKLLSAADYGRILRRPEGKALFFKLMDTRSPAFCPIKSLICSLCPELAFERTRNRKADFADLDF